MKIYTITKLSELSKLSKKDIRKHLIAQTLKNYQTSSGYAVEDGDLTDWLNNIPNIEPEELDSIFKEGSSNLCKPDLYKEIDIASMNRSDIWKNNSLNGIKFADFFCGAGGISLGLIMAGYEPVLGVEIDKYAFETYKRNIGERFSKVVDFPPLDISKLNNKTEIINYLKKENVQLICGGFPCQGFSLSGSRVISDPRNTLYHDMLDIVEQVKPDYILMENVLGLETIYEGRVLNKIISDYHKIGYKISFKELNAADYEVAQTRKRLVFIGNCINKDIVYPSKLISSQEKYITCGDILEKYKYMPENAAFNHIFSKHSQEMQIRLLNVPVGKCLYENYNDSWKKCPKDKPSYTIKGNHGATNIHYELPRVITPREMAALQSFPDDFIFYGSKQSILTQIGNAVPPYVARAVGLAILKNIMN